MISRMDLKKEEKKKAIMDAAEKIISEKGIFGLTMKKVAREADVATGTLYLYFNTKESLFAAVNARINEDINQAIKKKMDLYHADSGKIVAIETAIVEFSRFQPQKWKIRKELYHVQYENGHDPNVKEFLHKANEMIHMLANAYQQGIDEGTIHKDLDPLPTAIFSRIAFINAFTLTSEQKMLLELNKISQKQYQNVYWNIINKSTHIKPFKKTK